MYTRKSIGSLVFVFSLTTLNTQTFGQSVATVKLPEPPLGLPFNDIRGFASAARTDYQRILEDC